MFRSPGFPWDLLYIATARTNVNMSHDEYVAEKHSYRVAGALICHFTRFVGLCRFVPSMLNLKIAYVRFTVHYAAGDYSLRDFQ